MKLSMLVMFLLLLSFVRSQTNAPARNLVNLITSSIRPIVIPESRNGLQIPLGLEIISDSTSEQCVPSKGPYCYQHEPNPRALNGSECPSGSAARCDTVVCTQVRKERPLESLVSTFQFVDPNFLRPLESVPVCGLAVESNILTFSDHVVESDTPGCNATLDPVQPSVVFNFTNLNSSYTITFDIAMADSMKGSQLIQFLKIDAIATHGDLEFSAQFAINIDGIRNTTDGSLNGYYRELDFNDEFYSLVVTATGVVVFANGEVAMVIQQQFAGEVTISHIVVGFGSYSFRGTFTNFQQYSSALNTNEIYHLYSAEPLAKHGLVEDCDCSRQYADSFSLIRRRNRGFASISSCYSLTNSFDIVERYRGSYQGKWAVFSFEGWVSDFTDYATIKIKMPQAMLTYAVTGTFTGTFHRRGIAIKRPKSMEVRIAHPNGVVVYVSDNCSAEYNMPQTLLPQSQEIPLRKKRSAGTITNKCYRWADVLNFGIESEKADWYIPLMGPNELEEDLNDAFIGDVSITLRGQELSGGKGNNWYHLSDLRLYSRPHCDGHESVITGSPTNIAQYYDFHKVEAKAYECLCPNGISGDRCETCVRNGKLHRYRKGPGECANCECTDLADSPHCDEDTGQCDCKGDVDVELAGLQCHWYVSKIFPLYGPVAGGTQISAEGGYFTGYGIAFEVFFNGGLVYERSENETATEIEFRTPASQDGIHSVDIDISANSESEIGPEGKYYSFQYRPNPVMLDIEPRTTIIGGGTTLTITGEHLDSVAFPEMIVFIRKDDEIIETIKTTCKVQNGTQMLCIVGNLREAATPLLLGITPDRKIGVSSSTTTSTATTITANLTTDDPFEPTASSTTNTAEITTTTARNISGGLNRKRRSPTSEENLNDNYLNGNRNVQFTLGFVYDGHDIYKDLKNSDDPKLQDLSELYVYDDPELTAFDEVLEYHVEDYTIKISGDRLDYALSAEDYIITIGLNGKCRITSLSTNQLVCHPPNDQPEVDIGNSKTHKGKQTFNVDVKYALKKFTAGYIYYRTNFWNDQPEARVAIITVIVILCLIIIGVIIFVVVRKRCSRQMHGKAPDDDREPSSRYITSPGHENVQLFFPGKKLDPNIQANVDRCRIPAERLKLGKQLGKGNFGAVFKGQLITPSGNLRTVAVKTIKDDKEMSFEDMENFLAEGTLMIDFKHENVLSLIGVVSENAERPLVVLPFMENGDMCTFLKKDELDVVLADLLHFSLQIANGMAYLAKARFVHRDLAARNCMIDGSYIVKIADFGMSRDVYEKDYYKMDNMNKPLPMKWMAIESLKEGRFTSMSDVWSYGITMWELLTRGSTPYPGVTNYYIKEYVSMGKRLDQPSVCPPIIYELMCKCWELVPEERPTFSEIAEYIEGLLSGTQPPGPGSDEAAGYYYVRNATKDIPDDYLECDPLIESDNYVIAIPDTEPPVPPANTSRPVPAKRTRIPADTNDYVNSAQKV